MPYRETTKPFEMSDFYKYSTKYRKAQSESSTSSNESPRNSTAAHPPELPARPPHPQSPAKGSLPPPPPPPPAPIKKLPHPPDSGHSDTDSVGDAFSTEMLAWYNTQQKTKSNGSSSASASANNNKPATLVWEKGFRRRRLPSNQNLICLSNFAKIVLAFFIFSLLRCSVTFCFNFEVEMLSFYSSS